MYCWPLRTGPGSEPGCCSLRSRFAPERDLHIRQKVEHAHTGGVLLGDEELLKNEVEIGPDELDHGGYSQRVLLSQNRSTSGYYDVPSTERHWRTSDRTTFFGLNVHRTFVL